MNSRYLRGCGLVLALTCLSGLLLMTVVGTDTTYTKCGGTFKGDVRGVISTPNFPDPYPVPISCRWVIEAPQDKVVAVYFTQFYMREGLQISEYAHFQPEMFIDKRDYGTVSSDGEPTYLVTDKPIMVLDFNVNDAGNIHTRVREFFLDVFGFNLTYEVLGKDEPVRVKDTCIYHRCSFTGNCYANKDFTEYNCSCFADFYGDECQYSSRCGPAVKNEICQNGGTCRYYIGSEAIICDCAAGYEGSHCEKKSRVVFQPLECLEKGCSQTCAKGRLNVTECTCHAGFKLHDDKKSCIHTGRTRFLISFRLLDWNVDPARLGENRLHVQLKKGIENALLSLFVPRLHHVENLTVLDFHEAAVVQFHLFGNMEDSEKARQAMEEALRRGKVGNYSVDRNYIRFEWEPGLSIQGLEASESMPAVEGSELSLACIVQGSSGIKVSWLKDGAPINVNTSYRAIWTNVIPKNSKKQYTALLGFDTTTSLDTGIFTCVVDDWGLVQNKSFEVVIHSVPKPHLSPMTATIHEGDGIIITCLSQDDVNTNLGYNWLKNGVILNPLSEPEMIEDLFPVGSRILLKAAVTTAIYTCIITSTAGATRKDSVITVINKGRKISTCGPEEYLNVKWNETASNSDDIQPCPIGFRGDVKRQCLLRQKDIAMWEEPDFSGCLAGEFIAISKNFESLKMGYLFSSVRKVLEDLNKYLHKKKDQLHVSEGVPVVDLLDSIQEYEHRNIGEEDTIRNNSQVFLDVVSFLLTIPHLVQKQSHLIKLHHLLLSYGLLHGSLTENETFQTFERSTLVMEVGKIQKDNNKMALVFPKKELQETGPSWLTDSLELDIGTWAEYYVEGNNSLSVAVVFYKNLSVFLPKLFLSQQETEGLDLEYHLHSRLVGVAIKGKQPITTKPINGLNVKARLSHLNQSFGEGMMWNISCGVADFQNGKIEFSVEGCEPVSTGNYTLCQCTQLGTYAVLLTTFLQNGDHLDGMGFEMIAGLGCVICALLICLTLAILIIFWRQIQGAITALKIQICIALLGAYGTMLKALHESLTKEYFPHVISIIQFFLLAAFCMQLCMGLTVYIEFVDMRNVRYPELKIAAMGWAFPLIVVGATLAAQVLEGFRLQSWWLKFETNYFYAYVTSVFIVSLLQVLLFLTVKAELRRHEKADAHHRRRARNRASLLHRSLVLLVILLFVSVSSILYINFDDVIFKYIFAFSSALLGLVVFLSYTLLSENINRICFTCSNEDPDADDEYENKFRSRSNSYKSFLKPEIVGDTEYCPDAFPSSETMEQRHERIRRVRSQIDKSSSNHRDWKDMDHALLMPSVDKFDPASDSDGSHHADVTRGGGAPNFGHHLAGLGVHEHAWHCPHSRTGSFPPLELQQLEGSPRSSHLYLVEPPVTTASASPYDLSPTAESVSLRGGYPGAHSSGCQLHRGHSDASESESSQSSSTDDSALVPGGGAARPFVPYRPSSGLQFERAPISEEDETDYDGDKPENLQRLFPSDARGGSNPRTKREKSADDGTLTNPSYHRERALLRVSESCSTEGDSSEIELPTSHDEDGATGTSKKSWSITTV